jgi:DNA-directed RNA polymerase specialized sigma54-like protein
MASNQSLSLDQRLSMRLSAQQLRFVKLLEYNTPELEEAVERELDDNPALEVAEENEPADLELPSYRYGYSGGQRATDESANYDFSPPDLGENLYDSLLRGISRQMCWPRLNISWGASTPTVICVAHSATSSTTWRSARGLT